MTTNEWITRLSEPLPMKDRDIWMCPFAEEMKANKTFLSQFLLALADLQDLDSYTTILMKVRWFMSVSTNFRPSWLANEIWRELEVIIHIATDLSTPAYRIPVSEWEDLAKHSQRVLRTIVQNKIVKENLIEKTEISIEELRTEKHAAIEQLSKHAVYGKRVQIADGEPIY